MDCLAELFMLITMCLCTVRCSDVLACKDLSAKDVVKNTIKWCLVWKVPFPFNIQHPSKLYVCFTDWLGIWITGGEGPLAVTVLTVSNSSLILAQAEVHPSVKWWCAPFCRSLLSIAVPWKLLPTVTVCTSNNKLWSRVIINVSACDQPWNV